MSEAIKAETRQHFTTAAEVCDKIAEEMAAVMRRYTEEYPEVPTMGQPEKKFVVQLELTVSGQRLPEKANFSKVGFTNG